MITNVGTIGVNVRDQQRALEFYTQKLGFQVFRNDPMEPGSESPRWIEVGPAGAQTHLVLFTPPGLEDRIGTFSGYVFHCDDIRKTVEELRSRGVELAEDLRQSTDIARINGWVLTAFVYGELKCFVHWRLRWRQRILDGAPRCVIPSQFVG